MLPKNLVRGQKLRFTIRIIFVSSNCKLLCASLSLENKIIRLAVFLRMKDFRVELGAHGKRKRHVP